MNSIKEILKSKNGYERYAEILCLECDNSNADDCNIHRKIDGTYKCENYNRCMKNKCKSCKNNNKCFEVK